jgi:hypothetical protein
MLARLLASIALVFFFASAQAGFNPDEIGTIDTAPGATLLFPHFEVDTSSADGVTTVLTVQNASATAMLLNVVLWTDYGLPTDKFLVYLTGYDQETIDLGLLFRRILPRTASAGQDPSDTISPHGPISQDINFASCNGLLPDVQNGSVLSRDIVGAHSGQPSADYFGGLCGSRNLGDGIARGYVTVDTVNNCTQRFPGDPGYFVNGGSGDVTNQNVLTGDYVIINPATRRVVADSAVHIQSSATNPLTSGGTNKQTFYARLVGNTGADNREPLPTAWAGRAAAGRTDVDYWRDPGTLTAPFTCGTAPAGLPSGQRQVSLFSDTGALVGSPAGDLFPFTAGSTTGAALGASAPLGWLFANLNLPAPSGPFGVVRQSWLTLRQIPSALPAGTGATYTVPGIQLGNAAFADDPTVP